MCHVGDAARKRLRNHISQEKGDPVAVVVWRAAKVQLNLPSSQSCKGRRQLILCDARILASKKNAEFPIVS
jgi:hypothetical protein